MFGNVILLKAVNLIYERYRIINHLSTAVEDIKNATMSVSASLYVFVETNRNPKCNVYHIQYHYIKALATHADRYRAAKI